MADDGGPVPADASGGASGGAPARRVGPRRRRENVGGARRHAHQVKVSAQEELALQVRAGRLGISVPRLLVEAALAEGAPGDPRGSRGTSGGGAGGAGDGAAGGLRGVTPAERAALAQELFAVRRLLAGVANNVNQLARVANTAAAHGAGAGSASSAGAADLPADFWGQTGVTLAVVQRVAERVQACAQRVDGA
ncbi:plasmid mobilization relaxosome protein MobC [Kineococcus gypseus]|uniref:plasmid mobilization relaxosome protein MobC n=1 Tax=Kineococcus gypseus TaxID=1637102 RepID=UPI003D7C9162